VNRLSLLLLLLVSSCGSSPKPEEKVEKKAPNAQIVGRVSSISRNKDFVLIQQLGPGSLSANHLLHSMGPGGRSASLSLSGERVRDFYAADLVSGTVELGDPVLGRSFPSTETEEQPATLIEPAAPGQENIDQTLPNLPEGGFSEENDFVETDSE